MDGTASIPVVHSPRDSDLKRVPPIKEGSLPQQRTEYMQIFTIMILVVGVFQVLVSGGFGGAPSGLLHGQPTQARIAKLEGRALLLAEGVRNTTAEVSQLFEQLRELEAVPAFSAALKEAKESASGGGNPLATPRGRDAVEEVNKLLHSALKEAHRIAQLVDRATDGYKEFFHEK